MSVLVTIWSVCLNPVTINNDTSIKDEKIMVKKCKRMCKQFTNIVIIIFIFIYIYVSGLALLK